MDRDRTLHRSTRTSRLDREAGAVWSVVAGAGGSPRWYVDAPPFVVRGLLDRAMGGAGRRWPVPAHELLRAGDTAGFWRVLRAGPHALELEADVRAPGRVTLQTSVAAVGPGACTLHQSVTFEPAGLLGRLYLLADLPARELVIELTHRRLLADLATDLATDLANDLATDLAND